MIDGRDGDTTATLNRQDRRRFFKTLTWLGVGSQALMASGNVKAALFEANESVGAGQEWPEMTYRTLGNTGFEASRLTFGCGAALSRSPQDKLLNAAFDAGVNVFDVGTSRYYDDAERNLAPFLKQHQDDIFLISKAMVYLEVDPNEAITVDQARQAAKTWTMLLDESLQQLDVDGVDAYYVMAAHNPYIVGSEEILTAFDRAKAAGKTRHLGLSTHQNAHRVLQAAKETGKYDLAMIAITPGGWYSWEDKGLLENSPDMKTIQPFLEELRASGMGLIGMKAGRYLAGRRFLGWGNPDAFDQYYDAEFLRSKLNHFQRSYAFVLAHGLDCVNADMQNFAHLHDNFVAAATADTYFPAQTTTSTLADAPAGSGAGNS